MAPTEGEYTTWRGDNPGFQTQAVGNYPNKSDAADKDNIYLSDQGWAYRHYKNADKTKYWDEVIWSGYVSDQVQENLPIGKFGAEAQTFLVGDGFAYASGPYPATVSTIGEVDVTGAESCTTGVAEVYTATNNGSAQSGQTYAWTVFQGSTDVTSAQTVANGTTAAATITFAADGAYTVKCTVGVSGQASVTGAMNVLSEAANTADTIGTVELSGKLVPILGVTYQYTITYTGTAPIGDITPALASAGNDIGTPTLVSQTENESGDGGQFVMSCAFATSTAIGTSRVLTATLTDAGASDNPQTATLTATTAGKLGTVTAAVGSASVAQGTASTNCTSATTGGVSAATAAQTGTTFSWVVATYPVGGEGKVTFGNAALEDTTFAVAADAPVGTYTLKIDWLNSNCVPDDVSATVDVTVTA
jgi:hypothetical protein